MTAIVNGVEMTDEKEIENSNIWRVMVVPKDSEFAVLEFELAEITLVDLRNQFGFQDDDPYYFFVYDIEPRHTAWVEKHSNQKLDFTKYRYFLDSCAKREKA